jgi:hypothetical protein
MPREFTLDSGARARLAKLGFDSASLPHEYCSSCDLCGWQVFRTISHTDRYGFAGTYQMCEGCGLVFQNPRPTAEGYEEFYAKWYRPLIAALLNRQNDEQGLQADQKAYAAKVVPAKRFMFPPYSFAANYYFPEKKPAAEAKPKAK